MSELRRTRNPGRRERVARKRQRRCVSYILSGPVDDGPYPKTLKLGRKHLGRHFGRSWRAVDDSRNTDKSQWHD